jgi:hypothetical protein
MRLFNTSRYLGIFLVLTSTNLFAKEFPATFDIKYQLTHTTKNVGEVGITFAQSKGTYTFEVSTYAAGILRLLGDRKLVSKGEVGKNGFKPTSFEFINVKKPNKNIKSEFSYDTKLITTYYNDKVLSGEFPAGTLDLAIYLFQFNFIKSKNSVYSFKILEGKKVRIYRYKKLKQEDVKVNKKIIKADLYEGNIEGRDNSTHYVWFSKKNYRVPIKLKIQTDFGLLIEQTLVNTSLNL